MADLIDHPRTVLRLGRRRTQHALRVLIEGQAVVIRTRCGLDPLPEGFTETSGYVTCDPCIAAESALEPGGSDRG